MARDLEAQADMVEELNNAVNVAERTEDLNRQFPERFYESLSRSHWGCDDELIEAAGELDTNARLGLLNPSEVKAGIKRLMDEVARRHRRFTVFVHTGMNMSAALIVYCFHVLPGRLAHAGLRTDQHHTQEFKTEKELTDWVLANIAEPEPKLTPKPVTTSAKVGARRPPRR